MCKHLINGLILAVVILCGCTRTISVETGKIISIKGNYITVAGQSGITTWNVEKVAVFVDERRGNLTDLRLGMNVSMNILSGEMLRSIEIIKDDNK
jgi:hypothetical protein